VGTLNFNEYYKKYTVLINLFIIVFIAFFSAKIVDSLIVSSVVSKINISKKVETGRRVKRGSLSKKKNLIKIVKFRAITDRNIFNVKVREEVIADDVAVENVSETPLSLLLKGTIVVQPSEKSIAIILDKLTKKVDLHYLHDNVQGAEIIEIDKDKVVLLRNEKKEILTLYSNNDKKDGNKSNAGSKHGRSLSRKLANKKFHPPEVEERRFEKSDNINVEVNKVSEDSFDVDKEDFNNALSNMGPILTQARVVPYFSKGKVEGYKIFNIKPTGIFAKLGMKNGDIIKNINGNSLSSPEKALQMFQYLKTEDSFEIVINRYGKDRTLSYRLR